MKDKILYSVVVPVYNAEPNLEELVKRVQVVFKNYLSIMS